MATGNREVMFRFCVGDLKPSNVTLRIFDPKIDKSVDVACKPSRKYVMWTAPSVRVPKEDVQYTYKVDLLPTSEYRLIKAVKQRVMSAASHFESRFRTLPGNINVCRDVFEPPYGIQLKPAAVYMGLISHLQTLFDSLKTIDDLRQKLLELEHMYRALTPELVQDRDAGPHLREWIEKCLGLYSSSPHKIVFLSALYGRLTKQLRTHLTRSKEITIHAKRQILGSLENTEHSELTKWSLSGIRETALQALEAIKSKHWVYAAAYFPRLFDLSRVMDLRSQMSDLRIDFNELEKVLVPRIKDGYQEEEANVILFELPKSAKTTEQRTKLTELVEKYTTKPKLLTSSISDGETAKNVPESLASTSLHTKSSGSETSTLSMTASNKVAKTDIKYPPSLQPDSLQKESEDATRVKKHTTERDELEATFSNGAGKPEEKVLFQVLVRADHVTAVKLTIENKQTRKRQDYQMKTRKITTSAFSRYIWFLAEKEVGLPLEDDSDYQYEYEVTESGWSRASRYIDQTYRSVEPPKKVFDIFRKSYEGNHYEVMAQGSVVYAEMLLSEVSTDNLKDSVMLVEGAKFPGLERSKLFAKSVTDWLQEMIFPCGSSQSLLKPPQLKFVAVLLGKLIEANCVFDQNCVSEHCVQLLIHVMQTAVAVEFPSTTQKDLASVCTWLVKAVKGSWLYTWSYFHRLFDVQSLINMNKRCSSPLWMQQTLDEGKGELKYVLENMKENPTTVEQLIICYLDEIQDTHVLKETVLMCASEVPDKRGHISEKAVNQLNNIIKKRSLTKNLRQLFDIWQDLLSTDLIEMTNLVRKYLVTYLGDSMWQKKDEEIIRKAILCRDLYSSATDLKSVIQNMISQSSYPNVYENFLSIMKDPNILVCATPPTIQELLESAIHSLDASSRRVTRSTSMDKIIRTIYKILVLVRESEHLNGHERLQNRIDNEAYKIIKDVSIDSLFSSLASNKGSDLKPVEVELVAEHIRRRLRDDPQSARNSTNHMKKLQGNDGILYVSSGPRRDVLLSLIDTQDEPMSTANVMQDGRSPSKFETSILKIIRNAEFWIMIFNASGKFSKTIQSHPKSKAVSESLQLFLSMVSSRNITVNFVRQLRPKHCTTFVELLLAVVDADTTDMGQLQLEINQVVEDEEVLRKRLDDMNCLLKCIEHLRNTLQVNDAKDLAKNLRDLQQAERRGTITLKESTEEAWWGLLFPLIPFADKLRDLSDSVVFLNICRSVVEGTCPDIGKEHTNPDIPNNENESEDDKPESVKAGNDDDTNTYITAGRQALENVLNNQPIGTVSLVHLINEICIPTFQEHCNILLIPNLDISVRAADNMMDGISNLESLQTELKQIKHICGKPVPRKMFDALKHLVELSDLSQRSRQLGTMFVTFEITEEEEEEDEIHSAIRKLADLQFKETLTLQDLHNALQTVSVIEKDFGKEDWDIIEQLADSQELVAFLRPLVDEDLRNLIDAVEERSEQHVNETTVSDLIDVKRYMEALLKVQSPHQAQNFIEAIKGNRTLACKVKGLPAKIDSCVSNVHSLRDLYNNVANRGEMTKEIIRNALQLGVYKFILDDKSDGCNVVLTYQQGKSKAMYGLSQLNDYRSRALLIVNTQKHVVDTFSEEDANDHTGLPFQPAPNYETFISCVNTINDIIDLCTWLTESGHFSFRQFQGNVHSLEELQELRTGLKRMFDEWQAVLKEAREQYYFLNFFHSKQLWELDQFFRGGHLSEDLVLLLRFVNSTIEVDESFRNSYQNLGDGENLRTRLFQLGKALEDIFCKTPPATLPIPGQVKTSKSTLDSKVRKGVVFVAELEEESTKSIPVLLRLYSNTTGVLPEPSQIVFCHQGTSWEEISLLLKRCIGAPTHFEEDTLFAIVNVELLPTDTQFQLVNEIQRMQDNEKDYLLAMICCGGSYHHIIDQFSPNYTHCLHGFSDAEMILFLRTGWPEVEVVTSAQPGLGKTENTRNRASQLGLGVRTLHVSGPITKDDLVQLVKEQTITKYEVLHIDVATVSDPGLLDTFLFEMIVIGMSVSGTHMCMGKTTNVFVEVANTYQDKLRNSLTICSSFTRKHLEWTGFENFVISQDVNSPVQVVCHYLKGLSNGTLDKSDIVLTGQTRVSPLAPAECLVLLNKCFGSGNGLSFTTVNTFLAIFAQELRRMSASLYFTTRSLKDMLGNDSNDVRTKFVQALLEVSKDFTARSVKSQSTESKSDNCAAAALLDYRSGSDVSASQMVARIQGMVKWADSNHLLVVFHRQDSQTISILYRLLSKVPMNIRKLFKFQMKRELQDYNDMSQDQLHSILEKVCRSSRSSFDKAKLQSLKTNYALTPDNLLKMVLIHMRIKSRIPVIIMGETGCGKTTLITYLARVCEVPFEILNLHAGVSEQDILSFVSSLQNQADMNLKQEVWGFLDEINTCDHLGLLNEVICHHSLKGVPLPDNLIFIAACNPYCLRESSIISAGLEGKQQRDEMSKLVYRVHPLPETMMDYVWDYGSLAKTDEEAYIARMLGEKDGVFVELVVMSQDFMRKVEKTAYCVSLRDVNRCQHLKTWFVDMLNAKGLASVEGDHLVSDRRNMRGMILSLAHCYHSRLTNAEDRQKYRQNVATILAQAKDRNVTEGDIEQMIRAEQLDFLERMQLPEGTAKNEALRENVFVILVSILNRIPVFVVGKPGCSKSLSMQLIRSNLRGQDSKETYFKSLPSMYVVSYQGSESSTSEGIIKVFDKAKNYKKPDVMPVVLLDEIGLAEVSRFNPLKVLHSQLEPTVGSFPPVAVVGISNWALDAAKMNRAIHLSRPEPTIKDLADTAKSIRDDSAEKTSGSLAHHVVNDEKLYNLADAYSEYQIKQKHPNFHGLRDYYSLVKHVAIESSQQMYGEPGEIIENGILRNFGGLKLELCDIMNAFTTKIGVIQKPDTRPGTMDLIRDNMDDRHARHLMLITSGDSALNILEQTLEVREREHMTIFGSRFENDVSEEYNYRILSEIILCMERGVTLVLRDLENIYGSLYDMLNQNYLLIGKKRNCRVALGPFSNPMCEVHQDFRCIVLVDEQKVDYQNPPFLNRFEKQTLRFSDILTDNKVETIGCLRRWMDDICCVEGFQFSQEDMFLGLHGDTLPSLVYLRSQDPDLPSDFTPADLARRCQNDLMKVACPDAVLRASKSKFAKTNRAEVETFQELYFELPLHNGLTQFFEHRLDSLQAAFQTEAEEESAPISCVCSRTVVYTHSSIHTDVANSLEGVVTVQVEKLSKFKSERHFVAQMRHFWFEASAELLILQCMTSHDAAHMLLAKSRIDQYRNEYLSAIKPNSIIKHVCIIVHIDRDERDDVEMYPWQFNFLCGWDQFTLDTLEPSDPPLDDLLQGSVSDQLAGTTLDLAAIIGNQLLWCFSCIKYENKSRDVDSALKLVGDVVQSKEFLGCLKIQVLNYIRESERKKMTHVSHSWQVEVATNIGLLYQCSTLTGALIEHIEKCVREPLAKSIILLESSSGWSGSPCVPGLAEDTADFWQACFHNTSVFDVNCKDIPEPRGPESCLVDCNFLDLKYPFFTTFHNKIENNKEWLLHRVPTEGSDDDFEDTTISLCEQLAHMISHMPEIQHEYYLEKHLEDYLDDLYNTFAVEFAPNMPAYMRLKVMKWLMCHVVPSEKTDGTVTQRLALVYISLWSQAELLAAELQLIAIYRDVTVGDPDKLVDEIQRFLDGIPNHVSGTGAFLADGDASNGTSNTARENPTGGDHGDEDTGAGINGLTAENVEFHSNNAENQSYVDDDNGINDAVDVTDDEQSHTSNGQEINQDNDDTKETCAEETINRFTSLESADKRTFSSEEIPPDQIQHSDVLAPLSSYHAYQPLETILVTKVCKDVLPVKQVLEASGGLRDWQRKASSVLLLAGRVSAASPVLHFLRLCRDFVVILSDDFHITEDQLASLSELGKYAEDPLANEAVFKFITSTVRELKAREDMKSRTLQLDSFLTAYFGLCIEANLDTPLLPQIVDTLCANADELLVGSRPVLLNIIRNDIQNEDDKENAVPVCEKLICTGEFDEEVFPNLALIDEILIEQEIDSCLSAACCDIIEDVAFRHVTCDNIAQVASDDDPIWEIASKAARLVGNQHHIKSSLQFVAAAAFVRAFMKSTAELIQASDSKHFKIDSKYYVLARNLNGLLKLEEGARCENNLSVLQVFLLKCLRENKSLFDLRKLCVELADPITNLGKIEWQEGLFSSRIGYCPMSYVDFYSDALDALSAWQVQQDKKAIGDFIITARSSPAHRLALLAAAANTFYFIQTTKGLTDVDKQQAQLLFEETSGFSHVYLQFLNRILGLSDFIGILHLSESSSQESLEIASVIVHLLSIIVSYAGSESTPTAFMAFVDQNTPIGKMALPCTGEPSSVLKAPHKETLAFYNCVTCGLRIVARIDQDVESNCPACDRTLRGKANKYQTADGSSARSQHTTGYNLSFTKEKMTSTESVCGLSPAAYRVLDTFLHTCFLAGLCSGFVTHEQMASVLLMSDADLTTKTLVSADKVAACDDIVQEESAKTDLTTSRDAQDYLTNRLEANWRLLKDIFQSNLDEVTVLLHSLVRACTSEILSQVCPTSAEDRNALENGFSQIIDYEVKRHPGCQMQHKKDCLKSEGMKIDCLEAKLEELDPVQVDEHEGLDGSDNHENTLKLRRLFRKKHTASLGNFRSRFSNICQTSENNYPFLQLCLSRLEVVQYIRFLPHLLNWNALVVSRLNHIIKRDEAKRTKVDDFLSERHYHPNETAMTTASHTFSVFQKAWNHIRDGWVVLTGSKPTFGTMTAANTISECIVDKNEQDCHLQQMISTLKEVQNTFLMDTLAIVTYGYCPALTFLVKNDGTAALQTLPLHAAGAAIIQYKRDEWSDNLLVFHDVGTEYGQGVVINYNYTIIERQLARILVLNKALLIEGTTFSQFAYSDELFHACSAILSEIGTTILQQKLPKELKNTIEREQGRRQTFAKDMLDHLEVILVLLKKTGGNPGSSLDEYIKRWATKLPGSFPDNLLPEPRDGIKLQHIVNLYETLEDLLVGAVVESLHDDFRKDPPERSADVLAQKLKPLSIEKLEECAGVIRRFVFRFLRSDTKPNTRANLSDLVARSTVGTMDCSILNDLLPEDLEISHVVKILDFIDKQVEQRKDVSRKKDIQQNRPRASARAAGNRPGRRRRGVMGGVC